MKKSDLKQLIKEEILKILKENHKPGQEVLYKGTKYIVIDETPYIITLKNKKNNNVIKVNYNQFKKQSVNESPYPLIPRKFLITKIIKDNDLEDEFKVNFIETGSPSEYHLENVVNDLKNKGIDVSSIYKPIENKPSKDITTNTINPYDAPGGGMFGLSKAM